MIVYILNQLDIEANSLITHFHKTNIKQVPILYQGPNSWNLSQELYPYLKAKQHQLSKKI